MDIIIIIIIIIIIPSVKTGQQVYNNKQLSNNKLIIIDCLTSFDHTNQVIILLAWACVGGGSQTCMCACVKRGGGGDVSHTCMQKPVAPPGLPII